MNQTIAVIPARGGSKRIPHKNVKLFDGKPIIAYSIETAKASGVFDRVIVSTDSMLIADVARKCGAEVPFLRPDALSDDFVTTADVFLHALEWIHNKERVSVDYACCIYATAPFLEPTFLKEGYELLRDKQASTVFSVTTFPFTIFRALAVDESGRLKMLWPENMLTRSQDLPEAYHDAGQFYWVDVQKFFKEKALLSGNSLPVILPRHLVQDIDTPEDWIVAEKLFKSAR